MHVPDLRIILLSVSKIEDSRLSLRNRPELSTDMELRNSKLFVSTDCITYKEQECKSATIFKGRSTRASMEDWHRRMSHLNLRDLSTSHRDEIVFGMDIVDSERDFQCKVRGKMTRSPFPKKVD